MLEPIAFIDPHVHADCRSIEEFARLKTVGCVALVTVAGPGGGFRSPDSLWDHFRRLDRVDRARIEQSGLKAFVALGAHPSGIPQSRLEAFLDRWPDALRDHRAAAVGEIGLERCTAEEQRVLARGFEVAAEAGLPAIVHTPRVNKAEALQRILQLLEKSKLSPERVLLDHLDRSVLEPAVDSGCLLGLSVHPAKLSPAEAADIVAEHGPGRWVIDSDMGANPSHLFAIPAAVSAMAERQVHSDIIRAVVYDHAARLLGLST